MRPSARSRRGRASPVVLGAGAACAALVAATLAWAQAGPGSGTGAAPEPAGQGVAPAAALDGALARIRQPLAVRNVSGTGDHNEWNPRFSPDSRFLSFERRDGSAQAILVADAASAGSGSERISSLPPRKAASAEEALLGGPAGGDDSYNAQISFFPDGRRFVFVGNGGAGVYRLYQGTLGGPPPAAITTASKEDGHPAVSPDGRWLVYVSARSGIGKLVLRDLTTQAERTLTSGDDVDLYPSWSPDSRAIAYTSGQNDNHDVFLIPDVTAAAPVPRQLTTWKFDDLRPVFSPDGRWIAFYSNYNPANEEKEWSIVVVPADGSGPTKGAALAALALATNVVKDPEIGPAWLPWGRALVYARNLKAEWNPIYAIDAESRQELRLETRTRMNHDLVCSSSGRLAFRAQVASWDDIFVSDLGGAP